jgi:GAF domain-containing protein
MRNEKPARKSRQSAFFLNPTSSLSIRNSPLYFPPTTKKYFYFRVFIPFDMPEINRALSIPADLSDRIVQLLEKIVALDAADKCTLQVYDQANNVLLLVACHGFSPSFCSHFAKVKPFDGTSCGRAFGIGTPVIVSDVLLDTAFAPHLDIINAEGYRAVKSVPVLAANGKKYGVISTHYAEPHYTWNLNSLNYVMEELEDVLKEVAEAHMSNA